MWPTRPGSTPPASRTRLSRSLLVVRGGIASRWTIAINSSVSTPSLPVLRERVGVRVRLLLRDAMKGAQSPGQVDGAQPLDVPAGKQASQRVERRQIGRVIELRNHDQ